MTENFGVRGKFKWDEKRSKLVSLEKRKHSEVNESATFHRDEILDGVESPLTGDKFFSMSRYKEHLAESGYEITGGDHLKGKIKYEDYRYKTDPKELREDIERAYYDIKYSRIPMTEQEKEANLRELRETASRKRNHG